jgi:hypothetical protein
MNYSRPNRIFLKSTRYPARRLASLLSLAALIGGCAGTSVKTTTNDYYRDAQLCHAQNTAGPQDHIDETQYLQCMARLGWKQEAGTDPLLKSLEKCQKQAEHPATASRKPGGKSSSTGFDQAAYRECLRQRGIQGDLAAEPLQAPQRK